jgi:hypothetical protein
MLGNVSQVMCLNRHHTTCRGTGGFGGLGGFGRPPGSLLQKSAPGGPGGAVEAGHVVLPE